MTNCSISNVTMLSVSTVKKPTVSLLNQDILMDYHIFSQLSPSPQTQTTTIDHLTSTLPINYLPITDFIICHNMLKYPGDM